MSQRSRVARAAGVVRVSVEFEGIRNFRDLGGYPAAGGRRVRPGTVYRSGHLVRATQGDIAKLMGLGLNTVIDLRNDRDLELDGHDADIPGARAVRLPLTDPAAGSSLGELLARADEAELSARFGEDKLRRRLTGVYRRELVGRTEVLRRVFDLLLDDGIAPVVVHCSAGKDRAGWVSALLLLALGVEEDAVMADYLLSNDPGRMYLVQMPDGSLLPPDSLHPLVRPLFEARPEYLRAAFEAVDEGWGDMDTYLHDGIGLSASEQDELKRRFLVESAA